jgi:hypothetical protein
MKSRAIRLSKIHALNWYGYRDSLPVRGNLVLAGVTGSGKSILMDLLMLVLVGPEKAHHHFNRSATGSRSDRTIKGYCLLDTKREENGQPQYFHDKGVTTYIAAEFTWPDGSRVETWGLRFEFRNTAENDGTSTPFFCPGPLDRDDFLAISPDDGKHRPRTLPDFRAFIEARGGRTFASSREYLRDMANGSHLNFNKEVLERLLPSAMSFTNLKSFDDFCRRFVLPGEAVPVEDVVASYRDFESYERELRALRAQLDRLLQIRSLADTRRTAERDAKVARYLAAETAWEHAAADVASMQAHLEKLREAHADDERRLEELAGLIKEAEIRREQLLALLNESPDGRLYKELADRIRALETEIERLREVQRKIDGGLRARVKHARQWLAEIEKAPVQPPIITDNLSEAIRMLGECEVAETSNALSHIATLADHLCRQLRERFASEATELRRLRAEKADLDTEISSLRNGLPPVPQPLLGILRETLPAAQTLREVCEVADEAWRVAIEVAFTEKFAVVVAPEHYDTALQCLHQLRAADSARAGTPPQALIDPNRAAKAGRKPHKNSLAARIETRHPVARAVIDDWFGDVICVQTLEELCHHDAAILPDGLMLRGTVVRRAKHYDGLPFVGEGGLKRQLEAKLVRLGEIDAAIRRLEPLEREIERIIEARRRLIEDHVSTSQELVRIETLPRLNEQHAELMEKIQAIDSGAFADLEFEAQAKKDQVEAWRKEELAITRKGGHKEIEQAGRMLEARREEASRREDEFSRAKLQIDIMPFHQRYREWKEEMRERFPAADVRARRFADAATDAEKLLLETTGDLKVAMLGFKKSFEPKFDELPEDGCDTAAYEKILEKIEDANIPEYERKSATERKRWGTLFRTQVLSRMQQAIRNVENIISLLNHQLKRPIGHDRYKIDRKPNPDFRFYRELIDLNALHHEDELFFNSIGEDLRNALDTFLQTLVKNANSPEAARLLDYRQYFDYDLLVSDIRDPDARPVSVDKQSGKMSGGENQSPYFVAILASYLHAYNRHETRWKEPSLALVPIDEAFSKLSGERIQDCLRAMAELDLQGMFSMSSGNIPYAFSLCDELIVITKKDERRGSRVGIRNVPSVLFRDTPEGREWMKEHEAAAAQDE